MSSRVASTSPCTSRGSGRTRYQIDRPAMAATTSPTMMEGIRVGAGGRGGRCFLRVQGHSFRWSIGCLHLQSKPRQTCIVSFTRSGQNQGGGVLLVKSSRCATRAYLVRGLAHTGPELCQPLAGRGGHQHGDAGHPSCKLTVFTSQDVAAPLAGATPAPRPATPPRRSRAEIVGKILPCPTSCHLTATVAGEFL